MDSDEEDFVFLGTPIEREDELASRKKKAVAESSGTLRTLPAWNQEVRDEEGRRRFHGAFTGGFSAGYFNTAGSKEGWTPQTYVSSRQNRAGVKQQSILNFLDDDEKADMEGQSLAASMKFDTFGFTAAEIARKQAEAEQKQRPSAIPGPVPDELIVSATDSIGVKLLLKMGWRHGHSIKDTSASKYDTIRTARKAFLALSSDDAKEHLTDSEFAANELQDTSKVPSIDDVQRPQSTPVYVLNPKQDLHGLGFDPFKHAPEFREKKRSHTFDSKDRNRDRGRDRRKPLSIKDSLFASNSGKVAPGFGIGALEELDAEDDDVYASGFEIEDTVVQEIEEPLRENVDNRKLLTGKEQDILPGFKIASKTDYQTERYNPPIIPKDFIPVHKFSGPLELYMKVAECSPPDVPPPDDNNMKVLIDGVAKLVAQCGKLFEDLSKERNQSNPMFSFLRGGEDHGYYLKKLWEERQKRKDQHSIVLDKYSSEGVQKMTAETRGNMLGEKPLPKSITESSTPVLPSDIQLKYNLSDTFTEPLPFNKMLEIAKPFQNDLAKQERFEQFLKQKYLGGLRSTSSFGSNTMTEDARARERLDFEAAAEAIEKAQRNKENQLSMQQLIEMSDIGGMQFTSGGFEQSQVTEGDNSTTEKLYPKREEFHWRPSPILCKRFDLIDPYMGKPFPAQRSRSKMDSLIFTTDSVKATKVEANVTPSRELLTSQPGYFETNKDSSEKGPQEEVEVENVERPVDLYKAIFSDDSDDEMEIPQPIPVKEENLQKLSEVVNTTLSRLTAGDFLESLGKELGLEVPPDTPQPTSKDKKVPPLSAPVDACKTDTIPTTLKNQAHSPSVVIASEKPKQQLEINDKPSISSGHNNRTRSGSLIMDVNSSRHEHQSSDSLSTCERKRKHSKRQRHRSSSSDSDSSSGGERPHHSRSKSSKKRSSREKSSSSRKHHSKHHKHRSKGSSTKSSRHDSDRDYRKDGRRKERD